MEGALRDGSSGGLTPPDDLKVIETLRFETGLGFLRLDRHLARCAATCARLAIPFDPVGARAALESADKPALARIRLTVDLQGRIDAQAAPFEKLEAGAVWRVVLSPDRLDPADPWLAVKTTQRGLYDRARAALPSDADEVLFANARGEMCEGAITNLFADFGDGLVTPPLSAGLLPGVLREKMLESGACRAGTIPLDRLGEADRLFVGNSLRGLIPVEYAG